MTIFLTILGSIYCIIAGIIFGIGLIFKDNESLFVHFLKSIFWIIFIFIPKDKKKSKNLINF